MNADKDVNKAMALALVPLLALLMFGMVESLKLTAINGGEHDARVSVEVEALSDVHNGQFKALLPNGGKKIINVRRHFNTGVSVKAGEKWTLIFRRKNDLEGGVLYPYDAENTLSGEEE